MAEQPTHSQEKLRSLCESKDEKPVATQISPIRYFIEEIIKVSNLNTSFPKIYIDPKIGYCKIGLLFIVIFVYYMILYVN